MNVCIQICYVQHGVPSLVCIVAVCCGCIFMCMCMCVCVCVYRDCVLWIHFCVYVYVYVCVCVYHGCVLWMYADLFVYMMNVCMQICFLYIYMLMNVCMQICFVYIRTDEFMHADLFCIHAY